jgi:hypothetical protein
MTSIGCLVASTTLAAGDRLPAEIQLKAKAVKAAVYFTTFPAPTPPERPWAIGCLGDVPLFMAMKEVFPPGTLMKNRPIQLSCPKSPKDIEKLDVLFIGASEREGLPEILKSIKDRPILSIADTETFFRAGTMIHLAMEEDRLRPWVNLGPAQKAGLSFSSFFLSSARVLGK